MVQSPSHIEFYSSPSPPPSPHPPSQNSLPANGKDNNSRFPRLDSPRLRRRLRPSPLPGPGGKICDARARPREQLAVQRESLFRGVGEAGRGDGFGFEVRGFSFFFFFLNWRSIGAVYSLFSSANLSAEKTAREAEDREGGRGSEPTEEEFEGGKPPPPPEGAI